MKIERLSQDKIRIFLTFDDLLERGIQKEDMWRESPKVHELFSEMMDQAYSELGFDASGPLAVEVFALPAQGMVVIVTRGKLESGLFADEADDEDEEVYEMEVTLEQSDLISYKFQDFEDVISAAKKTAEIYRKRRKLVFISKQMDHAFGTVGNGRKRIRSCHRHIVRIWRSDIGLPGDAGRIRQDDCLRRRSECALFPLLIKCR